MHNYLLKTPHIFTPLFSDILSVIQVICKVRRLGGTRTASFGIIGHQMHNWEWNFTKRNNWDPNYFFHQFWWWTEFHPLFPFSWAPQLLLHIFSLLLRVQLLYYCGTLCIECWDSEFKLRFNKISLLCGYHWKRG